MPVQNRTPHRALRFLAPPQLAKVLGISRQYAARLIKRIPGAEMLYAHDRGQRWRISCDAFDAWRLVSKVSKSDNAA
jgi:hypothetical protein